jgi:hypothetical protein
MAKKHKNAKKGGSMGLLGVVLVVIALAVAGTMAMRAMKPEKPSLNFQKGFGYCTWSPDGYLSQFSDESLEAMRETGAEWVAIHATWYQTTCWSGDIQRTEKTPSDEAMVHAIRKAHSLGMRVMLKPHLDLIDESDGSWRGEIGCLRESDWEKWFSDYTDFIMHYVDMAVKEKVEIFCIGTELSTAATAKGYMWEGLISKVRSRYDGLLTYAAHWDRYQDIRFWDKLDFVGVNAYFPLTKKMAPTYEELVEGLKQWVAGMDDFYELVKKPIILPEIGCASADGAAIRPWEHVQRSEVNLELQRNYYRAILDTFWPKEWFYGLYWWYWGTNVRMGGEYNLGFVPQNKPAQEVVKAQYSKPSPR